MSTKFNLVTDLYLAILAKERPFFSKIYSVGFSGTPNKGVPLLGVPEDTLDIYKSPLVFLTVFQPRFWVWWSLFAYTMTMPSLFGSYNWYAPCWRFARCSLDTEFVMLRLGLHRWNPWKTREDTLKMLNWKGTRIFQACEIFACP